MFMDIPNIKLSCQSDECGSAALALKRVNVHHEDVNSPAAVHVFFKCHSCGRTSMLTIERRDVVQSIGFVSVDGEV